MGQATQSQKILILAANSNGLRLDQEIRDIGDSIRRGIRGKQFQVATRQAVRPKDIRRAIAEERPQIVHFCGHGTVDGSLILEDDSGQRKLVKPEGLAALFELHSAYIDCVLINACYSEKSAEAISQYINYVIGMNQAVNDQTAIKFAEGFYDALGYAIENNQEEFQRAFKEGIIATILEDLPGSSIPVLKKKVTVIKKDSCCPTEASNIERESITTSLKYFYYISKSKMEMLFPQFNLLSNGNVVSDILNLSNVLSIHGLIEDSFQQLSLKTSSFYHYSGVVKQGLFSTNYFYNLDTTYLLWTIFENSLILMFGSPRNILGNEFAWKGVDIAPTSQQFLHLSIFLDNIIETNDSWSQNLNEEYGYSSMLKRPHFDSQPRKIISENKRLQSRLWYDRGYLSVAYLATKKNKKATGAGLLCFQLLKDLPDSNIDTIFKIFSHYELSDKDSQLLKEIYRTEFSSNQDIIERDQAIVYNWNLKNVYIGSPLYVSIA